MAVMLVFSILVIVLLQVAHFRFLRQLFPERWRKALLWTLVAIHAPMAVYAILRLSGMVGPGSLRGLRPFFLLGMFFQVFTVFSLLLWGLGALIWRLGRRTPQSPGRRLFLQSTAGAGLGAMAMASGVGYREAHAAPEITRKELTFHDLPPGFDGLKIAHLTDLHGGPMVDRATLRRWRALCERETPDLVLFTGDFVDSLPHEIRPFEEAFQGFSAPMGCFAVLGNHDYFSDPRPIWRTLETMGIPCLENRHAVIQRQGDAIALFGLQDPIAPHGLLRRAVFGPGSRPQDVAPLLPKGLWRLALVHRPSQWADARSIGARLTLAGHTHGGQINLVPGLSSARMLGPYTEGLYRHGPDALYVSRGLGVVGLPVRLGAPPELPILTLRRK
ncbi:MAG: metallophosphoesterase [Firmicutes bacterium]|nr:metallophosphoesterase [Bacillota bacterium]